MAKKSSPTKPVTKIELDAALKKVATKLELKKTEKVLRVEILKVEEQAENIEEGQKRMEVTLNKISNQLDGFVGRVDFNINPTLLTLWLDD